MAVTLLSSVTLRYKSMCVIILGREWRDCVLLQCTRITACICNKLLLYQPNYWQHYPHRQSTWGPQHSPIPGKCDDLIYYLYILKAEDIAINKKNHDILEFITLNKESIKCLEIFPTFQLRVIARDKGVPSKQDGVTVTVIVERNPNQPEFIQRSYEADVNESIPVGSSVIQVAAQDIDGVNLRISFLQIRSKTVSFHCILCASRIFMLLSLFFFKLTRCSKYQLLF